MFHDRDMLLRPFSRWRLSPGEGEPAHGYFARLVADEEHSSCAVYGKEIGTDGRGFDPASLLDMILRLPLPEPWRLSLIRATAVKRDGSVHLAGEVLGRRQWSNARRRYCAACLAEDPVHRTWWDVLAVTRCHVHGTTLRDVGPDGRPIGWWWPSVDTAPDGQPLAEPAPRSGERARSLDTYIVGRLGYAARIDAPLLDGEELGVAIAWVGLIGRLLAADRGARPQERPAALYVGFAALSSDCEALTEAIRDWARRNPPSDRLRGGLRTAYGARLTPFPPREQGVLASRVWDALERAVAKRRGRWSRPGSTGAEAVHAEVALREIAASLGMPPPGVSAIADHLGLPRSKARQNEPTYFGVDAVAAIQAAAGQLVTHAEAARMMGIRPAELGRLSEQGFIRPLFGTAKGSVAPRYLSVDVAALVEAAMGRAEASGEVGYLTLGQYCAMVGRRAGDVIADVLYGRIPAARVHTAKPGLAALRFTAAPPAAPQPGQASPQAPVPIGAVANLLQVTPETVRELEKRGDLRRHRSEIPARGVLFDGDSVQRCVELYASSRAYLEILGEPMQTISARLERMGARPVVAADGKGSRLRTLFRRDEVSRLLGLSDSAGHPGTRARNEFWRELRGRMAGLYPEFTTPETIFTDVITIRNLSGMVAVELSLDLPSRTARLQWDCGRKASPRRWRVYAADASRIRAALDDMSWEEDRVSATATLRVDMTPDGVERIASCIERMADLFSRAK